MPDSSIEAAEQNALFVAMAAKLLRTYTYSPSAYFEAVPNVSSVPVEQWMLATFRRLGENPLVKLASPDGDERLSPETREVPKPARVRGFLQRVYDLSAHNEIDEGIDLIIEQFDSWLRAGDIDMCEYALATANTDKMQEDIVFTFLTATLAARKHLPNQEFRKQRAKYYERAVKRISQLRGEEFAIKLLARYA